MAKLVIQVFVWPSVQKDCRTWARACQSCQRSKVCRHTLTPLGDFTLPAARFLHVHIDLVGPLPTSGGHTYCLTAVDCFTHWPDAIPIPDITADTVARALLTGCTSRFGCPQTITTNQGRQFESQLFHSLAKLCGIQLSRTTANHPAANGLVERFQRTLKAAIMCHADHHRTEALSLVLFGICTACKEDLQASIAELMYGEPLRIPGQLLTPIAEPVDPAHLITQLRQYIWPALDQFQQHAMLPSYICAKRPQEVHARFPSAGHNSQSIEAPLQRPLPGPITEGEDNANPHARQAHHPVN
ncbi:hypothetical protein B7P43_G05326 [Cryptotermes secundus]|uniref:Integrase catalytic domain-containing protein n=1 Tax=Cryptotermes secundus TaxID=105785 RepID=A0A2J7PW12_9NEOP|nr:hypothetical protein B7P43_G05326 [Cryptotermes secundus]